MLRHPPQCAPTIHGKPSHCRTLPALLPARSLQCCPSPLPVTQKGKAHFCRERCRRSIRMINVVWGVCVCNLQCRLCKCCCLHHVHAAVSIMKDDKPSWKHKPAVYSGLLVKIQPKHNQARCQLQAKVSRQISCEESWLRLLAWELTPIMQHLHHSKLHSSKPNISLLTFASLAFHRLRSFQSYLYPLGTLAPYAEVLINTAICCCLSTLPRSML